MLLVCWSPKGGSGTSVVATGLAIAAARMHADHRARGTILCDFDGDIPGIMGLPVPTIGLTEWMAHPAEFDLEEAVIDHPSGIRVLPRGSSTLPESVSAAWVRVAGELSRRSSDGWTVIVDCAGRRVAPIESHATRSFVVVRPCYLALRRALAGGDPLDHAIVVTEPDRVLTTHDVESVLGIRVAASIPVTADIARRIDAGVIVDRPPRKLIDNLTRVVHELVSTR